MLKNIVKFSFGKQIQKFKGIAMISKSCAQAPDPSECQEIYKKSDNIAISEGHRKIKLIQAKYQKHPDVPVHLKNGITDKILFYVTMSLAGLGLLRTFKFIYDMSQPPSNDDIDEEFE